MGLAERLERASEARTIAHDALALADGSRAEARYMVRDWADMAEGPYPEAEGMRAAILRHIDECRHGPM